MCFRVTHSLGWQLAMYKMILFVKTNIFLEQTSGNYSVLCLIKFSYQINALSYQFGVLKELMIWSRELMQ